MTKLPVLKTVRGAYFGVLQDPLTALKTVWLWMLIVYGLNSLITYYAVVEQQNALQQLGWAPRLLATAAVAVAWHRWILLNNSTSWLGAPLNLRVGKYLGLMVLTTVVIMGPPLVVQYLLGHSYRFARMIGDVRVLLLLLTIWALVSAVLVYRLSLWLPAIAVDNSQSGPKWSWQHTHGNTWRILGGALLAYLPISALLYGLDRFSWLLFELQSEGLRTLIWNSLTVFAMILIFAQILIVAGYLALVYQTLVVSEEVS